jgi:predicted AAA+ superfamily ATPase
MSLLNALTPRKDVLAGELTESRFAAGLEDVIAGRAADSYGDPAKFFAQTYPSEGLRTLLNEALGRLLGTRPDAASVLRLETNFGGGKTHNLIALFHAIRTGIPNELAASFMDPRVLAGIGGPAPAVAAFVGTTAGASTFPKVDGIAASTPWGYLALQIAGREGYEFVRHDDETLSAPGSAQLR